MSLEAREAIRAGNPIIALVEQGVNVNGIPADNIVRFDRLNPAAHEEALVRALQTIRSQIGAQQITNALGWIAGIALGLVALTAVADALGSKE